MITLRSSDRRDIEELRGRFWAFHGALKQPLTELGLERATVKTGGEFCETSLTDIKDKRVRRHRADGIDGQC